MKLNNNFIIKYVYIGINMTHQIIYVSIKHILSLKNATKYFLVVILQKIVVAIIALGTSRLFKIILILLRALPEYIFYLTLLNFFIQS